MAINTITQQGNSLWDSAKSKVNGIIDAAYGMLAVVKPREATIGGEGWVFDIPKNEELRHARDITDHWTESGSYLNDHAATKPLEITLSGLVGTLVDFYKKNSVLGKIEGMAGNLSNRLTALGGTLGIMGVEMSPQAQQTAHKILRDIEMAANTAQQIQKRGENIVNGLLGIQQIDHIREQYNKLFALYETKELLTVITPWGEFNDMAITEISISSEEDTEHIANISITLKQLRIAEVEIKPFTHLSSRVDIQNAGMVNAGMIEGNKTALKQIVSGGRSLLGV